MLNIYIYIYVFLLYIYTYISKCSNWCQMSKQQGTMSVCPMFRVSEGPFMFLVNCCLGPGCPARFRWWRPWGTQWTQWTFALAATHGSHTAAEPSSPCSQQFFVRSCPGSASQSRNCSCSGCCSDGPYLRWWWQPFGWSLHQQEHDRSQTASSKPSLPVPRSNQLPFGKWLHCWVHCSWTSMFAVVVHQDQTQCAPCEHLWLSSAWCFLLMSLAKMIF